MENVTRQAVRNLRIANEVLYFASLDENGIKEAAARYFEKAAGSVASMGTLQRG
jgi:hypothetical protein